MGYTHYFRQVGPAPTEKEWDEILKAVKAAVEPYKEIICYEFDEPDSPPLFDSEKICFNGKDDDGHETFVLWPELRGFEFCKTARKPYDEAVVAALRAVKSIVPGWLELSSDGDGEEEVTDENPDGLVFP